MKKGYIVSIFTFLVIFIPPSLEKPGDWSPGFSILNKVTIITEFQEV